MLALIIILVVLVIILIILFIAGIVAHKMLFGKRFTKDPLVSYYNNLEFNINRKPLEVKCGKNILRGYDYNYDNYSKAAIVVFSHGMWCNVDAYNQDICTIAQSGYEVIAINHTGVDTSDGSSLLGFSGSLKALDSTISLIKANPSYKDRDIYVVGHSWGAYATLNITKYHSDIKKLVAMAPFASTARLLRGLLPRPLYVLIPFVMLAEKISLGKYANCVSLKSLNSFNGESLILHSKNDPMVNFKLNTGYLMEHNNSAQYLITEDRGHNPDYRASSVEYMNKYLTECKALKGNELTNYKKQADFHRMGELDMDIMNRIIEFLNK